MPRVIAIALVCGVLMAAPRASSAQAVGLRAGVSADPDQFFVGLHVQTAPLFSQVRFRPNVEVGFGDDVVLFALNFDLVWRAPIGRHPWSILLGGGPAANIYRHDWPDGSHSDVGGGLNILLGVEHRRGFFSELKVGFIDSPSIKFGIGFTFR